MRVSGWETRLADALESAKKRPFAWGQHDCASWALSVVEALTGHDYFAPFRGRYTTALGAHKLIRKTVGTLAEGVSTKFEQIPVSQARRGDLVMHEDALGICEGLRSWFLGENGLQSFKTLLCQAAWRVE